MRMLPIDYSPPLSDSIPAWRGLSGAGRSRMIMYALPLMCYIRWQKIMPLLPPESIQEESTALILVKMGLGGSGVMPALMITYALAVKYVRNSQRKMPLRKPTKRSTHMARTPVLLLMLGGTLSRVIMFVSYRHSIMKPRPTMSQLPTTRGRSAVHGRSYGKGRWALSYSSTVLSNSFKAESSSMDKVTPLPTPTLRQAPGRRGRRRFSLCNDHIFLFSSLPVDHGSETRHKDCESECPCFLWDTTDFCTIDLILENKLEPRRKRSV